MNVRVPRDQDGVIISGRQHLVCLPWKHSAKNKHGDCKNRIPNTDETCLALKHISSGKKKKMYGPEKAPLGEAHGLWCMALRSVER